MRGKLIDFRIFLAFDGITPADAGKTPPFRNLHVKIWDHPRGCGENLRYITYRAAKIGSPPRMRGKLEFFFFDVGNVGITPADAGKTSFRRAAKPAF